MSCIDAVFRTLQSWVIWQHITGKVLRFFLTPVCLYLLLHHIIVHMTKSPRPSFPLCILQLDQKLEPGKAWEQGYDELLSYDWSNCATEDIWWQFDHSSITFSTDGLCSRYTGWTEFLYKVLCNRCRDITSKQSPHTCCTVQALPSPQKAL